MAVMNMHDMCSYYLFLYSHWLPQPMRDVITRLDDCDTLLVNFLVSHVTRQPPVGVVRRPTPFSRHGDTETPFPVAETSSFYRIQFCMRRFTEQFGYMPLIRSSARFEPLLYRDSVSVFRKKYRQMENSGL